MSREDLQSALINAALDLAGATGSQAFVVPVPNTTPPLYVCMGESSEILSLAGAQKHREYRLAKEGPCRVCGKPTPIRDTYMGQATWRCDSPGCVPY